MSPLSVFLGVLAGLGLVSVIVAFIPRRMSSREEAILQAGGGRVKQRDLRESASDVRKRLEGNLRGRRELVQDALMVGRSLESHSITKITGLIAGGALAGGGGAALGLVGLSLPPAVLVGFAVVGALVGWWIPDSMLKTEAEKERKLFQQVAESWLELAAQLVTAGSDTFAALVTAASYSEQPVFATLRDALRGSAARGEPPWTGLRRLADERRLRFLDPFCASLEMAGTTGAGSSDTIISQVESVRSKAMHEADAAAASSGEKMGAPLALIGGAFMIIMGYPPLAGIMDSGSLTGPGL